MSKVKTWGIIILLLAILYPATTNAYDQNISIKNPKLTNVFLQWTISDAEATELAKWDFLILDMENQITSPDKIKKIRKLNPKIVILAYVSSQEMRYDTLAQKELNLRREMFNHIPESWYLRDESGNKISFWPETWMINITDNAPLANNQRFNDYLPQFIHDRILSSGLWDGIFYDNLWENVSWLNQGNLDMNNDGTRESAADLDTAWQAGVLKILQKTRALNGYDYIIMANSSAYAPYQPYLNGVMFEDFPSLWGTPATWSDVISTYQKIRSLNNKPNFYVINSTSNFAFNYVKMRYGLMSCLLFDDLYFSYDQGATNHGQTWWYDEYGLNLGRPKGPAYQIISDQNTDGLWRRDFVNGSVILNNSPLEQKFNIEPGFKKFYGLQDPVVNSGGEVSALDLGPNDGLILEPVLKLYNVYLKNWYKYQIYSPDGYKIQSNYEWGSSSYKSGELIALGQNNKITKITKRPKQVYPGLFDKKGRFEIEKFIKHPDPKFSYDYTFVDVNNDGQKEVLIAAY